MATDPHFATGFSARLAIGRRLKMLREGPPVRTVAEVGKALGCSDSLVSRIENGRRACSEKHFRKLMALYGVGDEERAELESLYRSTLVEAPPWYAKYNDILSADYAQYLSYEEIASTCTEYQVVLLPGLTQIEDYARAVTEVGYASLGEDQVDGLVEVRMMRQEHRIVNAVNPIECRWIITQAALEFEVGGPEVHRRQLAHLLELSQEPHVDLRVIPYSAGASGTHTGAFTILGLSDGALLPDVAFGEGVGGNRFFDDPRDLRRLRRLRNSLAAAALDKTQTRELIVDVMRKESNSDGKGRAVQHRSGDARLAEE